MRFPPSYIMLILFFLFFVSAKSKQTQKPDKISQNETQSSSWNNLSKNRETPFNLYRTHFFNDTDIQYSLQTKQSSPRCPYSIRNISNHNGKIEIQILVADKSNQTTSFLLQPKAWKWEDSFALLHRKPTQDETTGAQFILSSMKEENNTKIILSITLASVFESQTGNRKQNLTYKQSSICHYEISRNSIKSAEPTNFNKPNRTRIIPEEIPKKDPTASVVARIIENQISRSSLVTLNNSQISFQTNGTDNNTNSTNSTDSIGEDRPVWITFITDHSVISYPLSGVWGCSILVFFIVGIGRLRKAEIGGWTFSGEFILSIILGPIFVIAHLCYLACCIPNHTYTRRSRNRTDKDLEMGLVR